MKEDIFDVLIYLFENYLDSEIEAFEDAESIACELVRAGFQQPNVNKAFDWLESLTEDLNISATQAPSFRIFSDQEHNALDMECRDFLFYLERSNILSADNREIVIDRAMALKNENITLERLKWLVLMVLLSQSGDETAYTRMEEIVYELTSTVQH